MPPSHLQISTVSLGMLILDDIHIPTRPQPLTNVLGGSAAFVTLGERLFLDPTSVGCLVIAGHDFPAEIRTEIESWGTSTVVRQRDQPSSRGRLVYEDEGFGDIANAHRPAKSFTYTHPPLKAAPSDLRNTPLLHAKVFHLFGPPEEILILVPELLHLRHEAGWVAGGGEGRWEGVL
ncbi:hypothetical protein GRF29_164g593281 [Pseudopithomyces chartarum]|uniref:Uncharacterized protein n=1 Tax=Pseudopithomyces chartarum TaxID=1892770 RepID=A0AAN6LQ38_9PLEO|nr:hypothetical protein GRF29_164g593281 [Pseudopithomyces chartarum]